MAILLVTLIQYVVKFTFQLSEVGEAHRKRQGNTHRQFKYISYILTLKIQLEFINPYFIRQITTGETPCSSTSHHRYPNTTNVVCCHLDLFIPIRRKRKKNNEFIDYFFNATLGSLLQYSGFFFRKPKRK